MVNNISLFRLALYVYCMFLCIGYTYMYITDYVAIIHCENNGDNLGKEDEQGANKVRTHPF